MFKRVITIILVSLISLTCAFGSFASEIATSSNAQLNIATSSNAMPSDDFLESDDFDMLDFPMIMASGDLPTVTNTVDYSDLQLALRYYDMSNAVKYVLVRFNSSRYATMSLPSDCAKPDRFYIRVMKGSLPSSGRYRVEVRFSSNTGVEYKANSFYMLSQKDNLNATSDRSSTSDGTFMDFSGDWYYSTVIELGNIAFLEFGPVLKNPSNSVFPYGGYVSVNFTKTSDTPAYTTAGGSYTSDNATQDIANNTAQQVEQGDTIIELIKNTIQTISLQLTAFWNQLAGEFTNLYAKMTQQHSEQLQADRDNTDDIIAAEESNTTNIINNNNANTDKLSNGYDNSGMNSDNDRLNGSLTEYDQAEDNLMEDVNTGIGNIDFDFSFDSTLSVISTVSDFLQGIYERSGGFQVVINVCLILSLASCAVGLYRLKGGG
ncbi:MAG: hypothetical protein E7244_08905 [Enterocloster citroniae]|nr:hypothetical protein [Enterocloster citroniae]